MSTPSQPHTLEQPQLSRPLCPFPQSSCPPAPSPLPPTLTPRGGNSPSPSQGRSQLCSFSAGRGHERGGGGGERVCRRKPDRCPGRGERGSRQTGKRGAEKLCFFFFSYFFIYFFLPGEPAYTALFVIFFFMLKSHGLFVDVSCLNSVVCYLLF